MALKPLNSNNLEQLALKGLKRSGVKWLHFDVFSAIQSNLPFLISGIRALWRSALSARVPECQKLKTQLTNIFQMFSVAEIILK